MCESLDWPTWLPPFVEFNDYDRNWERYFEALYQFFKQDFIDSSPSFMGIRLGLKRHPYIDGKEATFWHLITKKDRYTRERLPDFRRAERLPWCRPILVNCNDPVIKVWDYKEADGKVQTYVWLENWDYVIILRKRKQNRGPVAFLVTAYHVDYNSTKRNLMTKYQKRQKP